MSWFIVATVLGFALYRAWWLMRPAEIRAQTKIFVAAVAVLFLTGIGAYLLGDIDVVGRLVAQAGDGPVVRFLIGIVLGLWGGAAPEGRTTALRVPFVVICLVLLAIAAPHLDRWLSHLADIKTSVIEIQLTNIATTNKT